MNDNPALVRKLSGGFNSDRQERFQPTQQPEFRRTASGGLHPVNPMLVRTGSQEGAGLSAGQKVRTSRPFPLVGQIFVGQNAWLCFCAYPCHYVLPVMVGWVVAACDLVYLLGSSAASSIYPSAHTTLHDLQQQHAQSSPVKRCGG